MKRLEESFLWAVIQQHNSRILAWVYSAVWVLLGVYLTFKGAFYNPVAGANIGLIAAYFGVGVPGATLAGLKSHADKKDSLTFANGKPKGETS